MLNLTMSLKAKIEAVIYASEEPVTLAQLAGLLGQEAQAELDHLDSAQQALSLEDSAETHSEAFRQCRAWGAVSLRKRRAPEL